MKTKRILVRVPSLLCAVGPIWAVMMLCKEHPAFVKSHLGALLISHVFLGCGAFCYGLRKSLKQGFATRHWSLEKTKMLILSVLFGFASASVLFAAELQEWMIYRRHRRKPEAC